MEQIGALVLLGVFEIFNDFNLIIKIFVLMTLASWVRNHLGDSPLSWILIGGLGYFILFDGWAIFGPIYLLYMLLGFGVSSVIIDFFFVGGGSPPAPEEGMESPVSSGVDIMKRMHEAHAAHHGMRRGG
ncbi:MAG TPA: hypothetical protein VJH23_00130 [archaeon]|nr:hypothetical protein [archaeon]